MVLFIKNIHFFFITGIETWKFSVTNKSPLISVFVYTTILFKVVDGCLQLFIDRMSNPSACSLHFQFYEYYMLIIGKNGVTTIIHITVGTTYFNTIVYCREVNRLFCPILYYCDPFVRRIDTDVCRCLRTLILIVTNSEVFCRDILHLALRYEKINHTFLHIIFVSHYQFPLRFQAADQTIHLSSPIGCSRNYHQKVCRPHCLKNTLFYPSIHIFSENQD